MKTIGSLKLGQLKPTNTILLDIELAKTTSKKRLVLPKANHKSIRADKILIYFGTIKLIAIQITTLEKHL